MCVFSSSPTCISIMEVLKYGQLLEKGSFMEPRIDFRKHAQEAQKAMYGLEKYIGESGLDHKLIHLIKMRASQINGCAYCIDMHSKALELSARPNKGSMDWMPGARLPFTRRLNGPRLSGRRHLPWCRRRTSPMPLMTRLRSISAKRKSWI